MKSKDTIAITVAATQKTVRSLIRMKYSLMADNEINDVLPQIVADVEAAALRGEAYTPDYARLFEGL